MNDNHQLKTDPDFLRLCSQISETEYQLLAESIRSDGCENPIFVWRDIILDGHKRYRICSDNDIPFEVRNRTPLEGVQQNSSGGACSLFRGVRPPIFYIESVISLMLISCSKYSFLPHSTL